MAKILIHIHTGPENPTKAALGLLVGLTAHKEGHEVSLFLAGDGVHLLSSDTADVTGVGTGRIGDHVAGLREAGVTMALSGMSAKARGYDDTLLSGFNASFGMPTKLLEMTVAADRVLCY
jgi:predicted peroxiredoxin